MLHSQTLVIIPGYTKLSSDCFSVFTLIYSSLFPPHSMDGYANTCPPPPPPAPLIPSAQTAFASPPGGPMPPGPMAGTGYAPPPLPVSGAHAAPPPPGPPPPPLPAGASHFTTHKMSSSAPAEPTVVSDARSDLLAAIRMGKSCNVSVKMCHCNALMRVYIITT